MHTGYSLRDATIRIDDLIPRLKELGQTAVAITDHGNMYASIEAFEKFSKAGLKVINGCEVYICDTVEKANANHHLILLAKNEQGRQNLQWLVSQASIHKYNKPRIDFRMLSEHHEGLICLSACMAGEVSAALQEGNEAKAKSIASKYKSLFGDDYYIEYQAHFVPEQQILNTKLCNIADELGIEVAVTADAHYLLKEDKKYHSMFIKLNTSRDAGEIYDDCYIQSVDEIISNSKSTAKWNERAIANTVKIAEKCENTIPLSAPIIPHVQIPEQYSNEEEYLRALCNKGFEDKGFATWTTEQWQDYMRVMVIDDNGEAHESYSVSVESAEQMRAMYMERYEYEMNALTKMGFVGYYIMVFDYVCSAKRHGIARGSGGGSLLAYLCGIVDIDPIKNGLYFERFIDVGAIELLEKGQITAKELKIPDFDVDFPPKDREDVLNYIINRYGSERVVSLGQFQFPKAKGTFKNIARCFDIPYEEVNEASKFIDAEDSVESLQENENLKPFFAKYPELPEYIEHLVGLPNSFGVHPCGKVVCIKEATYYHTLEYNENGGWVMQCDGHCAEDLGLVKIDLLGLRTLSTIYDTLEMIGKDYNYIAPHKINMSDKEVWDEFRKGNTNCIFQFESQGMKDSLRQMKCETLDELALANALFRPGSMDKIPLFAARKDGNEPTTYIHPDLQPILKVTYGILVFQEQLIEIGRLAKLRNPDEIRKATAKKKVELMAKVEPELKQGLQDRGWTQEQVDTLWDDIVKFAKYSFNKSHASAYALTAYITMYLKVHHSAEFMTADINSREGDAKKVADSILEAKRMGLKIKFPKWGQIQGKAYCKDGVIYLGTEQIKGYGEAFGESLQAVQSINYGSLFDLFVACVAARVPMKGLKSLALLGAFSQYGSDTKMARLVDLIEGCTNNGKFRSYFNIDKLPTKLETLSKFGVVSETRVSKIRYREMFDWIVNDVPNKDTPIRMKIATEFELIGVPISFDSKWAGYLYVTEVDAKYSPKITAYALKNGTFQKLKISKRVFNRTPIYVGNIIKSTDAVLKPKVYKNESGDFVPTPDGAKDMWLQSYTVIC